MTFASVVSGGLRSPSVGKEINVVNEFLIRVTWVGECEHVNGLGVARTLGPKSSSEGKSNFQIGHAFKGSHGQPFTRERLGELLCMWWAPPYLWEVPKTASILFCYPPTASLID